MKTKFKLTLGVLFASFGLIHAQNGLEKIKVEKYYIATAADAAASVGTLPVGSVTYRVYADMLPGYKFQVAYGTAAHPLEITTSTTFFNNQDRGAFTPNGITVANTKANTVALDSWFSVGATASGKVGVLKSDDTDGSIFSTLGATVLAGGDATTGIQIKVQDGSVAGTPAAVTFIGFDPTEGVFDATSQFSGSFSTSDGAWSSLSGSMGANADTNRVLIGQFTTDGVFGFKLNIQIGTPTGGAQNYVVSNPTGAEISIPSLKLAPNLNPTVSITAPLNGANVVTGDVVAITANAADVDGTVASVEFFVDGVFVGVDNTYPYTANYTSVAGSHVLTAKATDNQAAFANSSAVTINVANNQAPTVSVNAAATAVVGDLVAITATAADVDGTVASVQFFVDGSSIGTVTAPAAFTMNWTATAGTHSFTAKATDNRAAFTTSAAKSIAVSINLPPTVSLTSPLSSAVFTAPAVVTLTAAAADADGSVTSVEFFVNGTSIGSVASAPYTTTWISTIGAASFTAKATDNKSAVTTSAAVVLSIADQNALPYKVVTTTATCIPAAFCLPVVAVDPVADVIGYDLTVHYDKTKITPTGTVTVGNALISSSYVEVVNNIDAANGVIYISAYFNGTAPANATFHGTGELFCIGFTKTANFHSVDTAIVSVSSLEESYFVGVSTKLVKAGKYITYKDDAFHGALKFWSNNSVINYNVANPNEHLITNIYGNNASCNAKSVTAVQPDLNGLFTYSLSNGLDLNIEKDVIGTTDIMPVVNGADALLARKVLVKDASFIPSIYQIVAMDVNADGLVSAGDVSQINQRTVLMIPEFKQAWNYTNAGVSNGKPSRDWLFVDSTKVATDLSYKISSTYPANDSTGFSKSRVPVVPFCLPIPVLDFANCPVIASETYRGIMIGDVNGSYATTTPNNAFKQDNSDRVVFDIAQAAVVDGYLDVPVTVSTSKSVNALDFSMQYNDNLTFSSIVNHTANSEAMSYVNSDDQTLRFTSNSMQKYNVNQSVVTVRFAVNAGHQVNASDLQSVLAFVNGDSTTVAFTTAGLAVVEQANNQIINVYPNPATSNVLNIVVSEKATVELMDIFGRVVVSNTVYANEKQEMNIENLANGVYTVRIKNDEFVTTREVVINK